MPHLLTRSILTALAVGLSLTAGAEPLPRRESNVSVRNEVQLAIDKGLAHLQSTQRADGTWGQVGTTGFALMALYADPREQGRAFTKEGRFFETLQKGYAGLRSAFPVKGDLQKMDDFAWNVPPAVVALRLSVDRRDVDLVARARQAVAAAPLPDAPETRALFLAVDPQERSPGKMPMPRTGSALAAWFSGVLYGDLDTPATGHSAKVATAREAVTAWLRDHYTLERNPEGEGVHRYYYWLTGILGPAASGFVEPDLKLATGLTVDIPRQLAERLINEQNGNGSWSGVGDHRTEQDPDLVTAMCLLTLERVYGQL
jgi:hypothetical protein